MSDQQRREAFDHSPRAAYIVVSNDVFQQIVSVFDDIGIRHRTLDGLLPAVDSGQGQLSDDPGTCIGGAS